MHTAVLQLEIWTHGVVARLDRSDRGASLVEYALLVALIAMVCFAAIGFLGGEASDRYDGTGSSFAAINSN